MGGFSSAAQVALPLVTAIAAPYAAGALMGTGGTIAAPGLSFGSILNAGLGVAMNEMAAANQRAYQRQAMASQEAAQRQQMAYLQAEQQNRDRQRRNLLEQQLASQRARFAAQGIGGGGSATAVLKGLERAGADEEAEDRNLLGLKLSGMEGAIANRRRLNLLDEAADGQARMFSYARRGIGSLF